MNHLLKKCVAIALAVVMIVGMMPLHAFYDGAPPIPSGATVIDESNPQWEWVQIYAAGAFDYQRDYVKRDLRNDPNLWSRLANPASAFGPSNPTNGTQYGDGLFTGVGLFVDGISYRFGHGVGDYRRIYRQPNRDLPDLTITEITWDIRWHFRGARLYLLNVEFTDGTVADRYYVGDIFNRVYSERDNNNTVGGYMSDGFSVDSEVVGGIFRISIWFADNIVSAEAVRLEDFTGEIHNWSTARNGDPDTNTGPNPRRTFSRYCSGFCVDAMSAWYRKPVGNGSDSLTFTLLTDIPNGTTIFSRLGVNYLVTPSQGAFITNVSYSINGGEPRAIYTVGGNDELGWNLIRLDLGANDIVFTATDSNGATVSYAVTATPYNIFGIEPPDLNDECIELFPDDDYVWFSVNRLTVFAQRNVTIEQMRDAVAPIGGTVIGYIRIIGEFTIQVPQNTREGLLDLADYLMVNHPGIFEYVTLYTGFFLGSQAFIDNPHTTAFPLSVSVPSEQGGRGDNNTFRTPGQISSSGAEYWYCRTVERDSHIVNSYSNLYDHYCIHIGIQALQEEKSTRWLMDFVFHRNASYENNISRVDESLDKGLGGGGVEILAENSLCSYTFSYNIFDFQCSYCLCERLAANKHSDHAFNYTVSVLQCNYCMYIDIQHVQEEAYPLYSDTSICCQLGIYNSFSCNIYAADTDLAHAIETTFSNQMPPTNDPWWGEQEWGLTAINVPDVWRLHGDIIQPIGIGIVDDGVNRYHEDLRLTWSGTVSEGRGTLNHGSHVMGTIGGLHWNNLGVSGIVNAHRRDLFSYDASEAVGIRRNRIAVTSRQVRQGLTWNVEQGARIINFSLGQDGDSVSNNDVYGIAIQRLLDANREFLIIHAAGNWTRNALYSGIWASVTEAHLRERIITVGAVNREFQMADFTSYGPHVDVVAPGVDIFSTLNHARYDDEGETNDIGTDNAVYGLMSGTSMAAPHVAGVLGLILGARPDLTGPEARQVLIDSARASSIIHDRMVTEHRTTVEVQRGVFRTVTPSYQDAQYYMLCALTAVNMALGYSLIRVDVQLMVNDQDGNFPSTDFFLWNPDGEVIVAGRSDEQGRVTLISGNVRFEEESTLDLTLEVRPLMLPRQNMMITVTPNEITHVPVLFEAPYTFDKVITTVDQLLYVTSAIKNNGLVNGVPAASARYRLAANLDLSNVDTFFGIGTFENPFSGTFYGAGHRVRLGINRNFVSVRPWSFDDLETEVRAMPEERYIRPVPMRWDEDDTTGFVGLFRVTDGATISNVTVEGEVRGIMFAGGIVGYARNTTISNVESSALITIRHWDDDAGRIGGIAGFIANSTIINSTNRGNVDTGYISYGIGGIAGEAHNSEIIGGMSIGNISGTGQVGGIVGWAFGSHISTSFASGNITGGAGIGGIVGSAWEGTTITSVHVFPGTSITGEGGWAFGGIVGDLRDSSVTHSRTHADVTAVMIHAWDWPPSSTGGIVGSAWGATITDNEMWGTVYGYDDTGYIVGSAANSYLARNTVHQL